MILLKDILLEGVLEEAALDFIKKMIKGTEWEGKIFLTGGAVRDELMGKDPKDLDIMVEAPNGGLEFAKWITRKTGTYRGPEGDPVPPPKPHYNVDKKGKPATPQDKQVYNSWIEQMEEFQKQYTNPVIFPRFGTAKFNLRGIAHNGQDLSEMNIEAVMPRQETYIPGSRKPEVQFTNLKGDAERRDLTINAMYKNLSTGEYIDPTGMGMKDLKAGILRTPLDPEKTFTDDPLRMLRVVRFYAKYGWKFNSGLIRSLKTNAPQLENISKERIMEELNKMLVTVRPEKAMKLLKITGLMDYVIPEFKAAYNMTQNKHHHSTVWQHTLDVLKKTKPELLNRLTALFHDIGKIATRAITPKGVQFIGHEKEGAEMALRIMHNLKYPNDLSKAVALGVANHMKLKHGGDNADISDKTLRKFQREVGDKIENILDVIHADNISHSEESSMPNQIEIIRQKLAKLNADTPEKKGPPINGNDIQKEFGIKPGPIIGKIMGVLVDKMDENPNLSREEAMNIAKSLIGQSKDTLKEGSRIDHLTREIERLEREWERLDNMGVGHTQQQSISKKLIKLKTELSNWQKLYGAIDENTFRTLKGTPIKRYKNLVGKQVGSQLYVHKKYASKVIPTNILQKAMGVLRRDYPNFKFNTLMLDARANVVRFDEAPDFDTAREPHVGKVVAVFPDGSTKEGKSNSIWHHKWMWVMDDYDGFDVQKSKDWSRLWLSKVPEIAKGTDQSWGDQLQKYGVEEGQSLEEGLEVIKHNNKVLEYIY